MKQGQVEFSVRENLSMTINEGENSKSEAGKESPELGSKSDSTGNDNSWFRDRRSV